MKKKKQKAKSVKSEFYDHEIDEWVHSFRNDYAELKEEKKDILGTETFPNREVDILGHIKKLCELVKENPEPLLKEELRVYRALYHGYGCGWYVAVEHYSLMMSDMKEANDRGMTYDALTEEKDKQLEEEQDKEITTILDREPINDETKEKWKHEISKYAEGHWVENQESGVSAFYFDKKDKKKTN